MNIMRMRGSKVTAACIFNQLQAVVACFQLLMVPAHAPIPLPVEQIAVFIRNESSYFLFEQYAATSAFQLQSTRRGCYALYAPGGIKYGLYHISHVGLWGILWARIQGTVKSQAVPMGTHSSSPKNRGWAHTRRTCSNVYITSRQVPTPKAIVYKCVQHKLQQCKIVALHQSECSVKLLLPFLSQLNNKIKVNTSVSFCYACH